MAGIERQFKSKTNGQSILFIHTSVVLWDPRLSWTCVKTRTLSAEGEVGMSSYTSNDFRNLSSGVLAQNSDRLSVSLLHGERGLREGRAIDACGDVNGLVGFMKMKAGGYAYVSGWCDYTGWGARTG